MASPLYYDRVMETSTTTGTGTYTLAGAVTGYQTFGAVGNAKTCQYAAWEVDGNGNASGGWEVGIGTYTVSGTTLARTTILASSNSNNAVSWSAGTRRIAVTLPAAIANEAAQAGYGAISGLELVYSSTTALQVNAGQCAVNNKFPVFAQTTYTSGSTMKDIANSTVTLGASTSYWVFISDAGVIGIEINDGTGDGAAPVFDTTLDYWKAASTGAAWRRIGKFWTDGSSHIIQFTAVTHGRYRRMRGIGFGSIVIVNNGQSSTASAVTITPYITSDDIDYDVTDLESNGSTSNGCGHNLYIDGGTTQYNLYYVANLFGYLYLPTIIQIPNTGTLHYSVTGGGAGDGMTAYLTGVGYYV